MKIAILDSGVDCNHPMFVGKEITVYLADKEQHKLLKETEEQLKFGHGTAIYGIISSTVSNAEIINIHIPNIENGIKSEDLCEVLELVWNNEKPDIFNLSLGIVNCNEPIRMKEICDRIVSGGGIIVNAQ